MKVAVTGLAEKAMTDSRSRVIAAGSTAILPMPYLGHPLQRPRACRRDGPTISLENVFSSEIFQSCAANRAAKRQIRIV